MSTISVVLAAYNGEKYIKEQLLSMARQTVVPNEIIVSDDGSTDKTLHIVKELQQRELFDIGIKVTILSDNPRHGYCGNFEWALNHSNGDYIFFSDQDDVWLPNKVESVIAVFEKNPDAVLVMHDAELIGKDGQKL